MDAELRTFMESMQNQMNRIEQRMDGLDRHLVHLDERMDSLDQRMGSLEQRMDGLDQRIGKLDQRVDGIENRLDRLEGKVDVNIEITRHIQSQVNVIERRVLDLTEQHKLGIRQHAAEIGELRHDLNRIKDKVGLEVF